MRICPDCEGENVTTIRSRNRKRGREVVPSAGYGEYQPLGQGGTDE